MLIITSIVQDAIDFTKHYQRRKFNQIEADVCIVYELLAASIKSDKDVEEDFADNKNKS